MMPDTELVRGAGEIGGVSRRSGLNWLLALLTIPGAALVMLYAVGQVMGSTTGCTDEACQQSGPGELWFGVLTYGAPIVALVTIGISFLTAKRTYGIVVPLAGLALLLLEVAVLTRTFGH